MAVNLLHGTLGGSSMSTALATESARMHGVIIFQCANTEAGEIARDPRTYLCPLDGAATCQAECQIFQREIAVPVAPTGVCRTSSIIITAVP